MKNPEEEWKTEREIHKKVGGHTLAVLALFVAVLALFSENTIYLGEILGVLYEKDI